MPCATLVSCHHAVLLVIGPGVFFVWVCVCVCVQRSRKFCIFAVRALLLAARFIFAVAVGQLHVHSRVHACLDLTVCLVGSCCVCLDPALCLFGSCCVLRPLSVFNARAGVYLRGLWRVRGRNLIRSNSVSFLCREKNIYPVYRSQPFFNCDSRRDRFSVSTLARLPRRNKRSDRFFCSHQERHIYKLRLCLRTAHLKVVHYREAESDIRRACCNLLEDSEAVLTAVL